MIAPHERQRKMLKALKIRIAGLEDEYDQIVIEMDQLAAYLDFLLAQAWDRHDRLVDMRALAFRVASQRPESVREAA